MRVLNSAVIKHLIRSKNSVLCFCSAANVKSGIQRVGVIGADKNGLSLVIHLSLYTKYKVYLFDTEQKNISQGLARITEVLDSQLNQKHITESNVDLALNRIAPAGSLLDLDRVQIVLDCMDYKSDFHQSQLMKSISDNVKSNDAIIASHFGSKRLEYVASLSDRPDKFIGIQFESNSDYGIEHFKTIYSTQTTEKTREIADKFFQKFVSRSRS